MSSILTRPQVQIPALVFGPLTQYVPTSYRACVLVCVVSRGIIFCQNPLTLIPVKIVAFHINSFVSTGANTRQLFNNGRASLASGS